MSFSKMYARLYTYEYTGKAFLTCFTGPRRPHQYWFRLLSPHVGISVPGIYHVPSLVSQSMSTVVNTDS